MNGCENVWADVFGYILTVRKRLVFHFSTLTRPWFISFNCVQTSKSNIFWNSAFARKSGLNPLCRFQDSNISCPSKRRPSLMGVSAARLWRWAGRRRSCGTSHDACQHSVVMRQCLRLFYLVISARCTVWEEREMHKYVWISRQATEVKKKKHCVIAENDRLKDKGPAERKPMPGHVTVWGCTIVTVFSAFIFLKEQGWKTRLPS